MTISADLGETTETHHRKNLQQQSSTLFHTKTYVPLWHPIRSLTFVPGIWGISIRFTCSRISNDSEAISEACRFPLGFGTPAKKACFRAVHRIQTMCLNFQETMYKFWLTVIIRTRYSTSRSLILWAVYNGLVCTHIQIGEKNKHSYTDKPITNLGIKKSRCRRTHFKHNLANQANLANQTV